jgi:hypothetical protein
MGATNFIVFNTKSISELRRLHVCEVGDIGHYYPGEINKSWGSNKRLFDDWDKLDWIEFYNFIFHCISYYLKNGLVENPNPKWKKGLGNSQLIQTYGQLAINWVLNYLKNTRVVKKHYLDGQDPLASELFTDFINDVGDNLHFNETRFKKMIFDVCNLNGYIYNPLQINGGDTPNARKKQRGGKHCIHIVHPND